MEAIVDNATDTDVVDPVIRVTLRQAESNPMGHVAYNYASACDDEYDDVDEYDDDDSWVDSECESEFSEDFVDHVMVKEVLL